MILLLDLLKKQYPEFIQFKKYIQYDSKHYFTAQANCLMHINNSRHKIIINITTIRRYCKMLYRDSLD